MLTERVSKDSLEELVTVFEEFNIQVLSLYNGYTLKETIRNKGITMNKIIGNLSELDDETYILKVFEEPYCDPKHTFERIMHTYSLE